MKNLEYLELTEKQRKALKAHRAAQAKKRSDFLAKRSASIEKSKGPLEMALSPSRTRIIVQNTGSRHSFVSFDREHALQFANAQAQFKTLISQLVDAPASVQAVDDRDETGE